MSDEALRYEAPPLPAPARQTPVGYLHCAAKDEGDTPATVRRAALAMLIAFALFGVFDTAGLRHFTRDLPGNALTDRLVDAADHWHALMLDVGPARVGPAVREVFERLHDIRW